MTTTQTNHKESPSLYELASRFDDYLAEFNLKDKEWYEHLAQYITRKQPEAEGLFPSYEEAIKEFPGRNPFSLASCHLTKHKIS